MERSEVGEINENLDPEISATQENAPSEYEEKPNATCVSALNMTLKSLGKTTAFACDVLIACCKETHQKFVEEYLRQVYDLFLSKLSFINRPMEESGGVFEIFYTVLEFLPVWNLHLVVWETRKRKCRRCKIVTQYLEPSYGIIITASSLRETKSAFEHFSFESILKVIRIRPKMLCKMEACGKRSYLQREICVLPSVFTIALDWENNERSEEIFATTSVLATEIDISAIYKYEGLCPYTKYHLVSMVCLCGDQYHCIAYEDGSWVIYFGTENENVDVGHWGKVLSIFVKLNIRPVILFFENAMQRKQIVDAQKNTESAWRSMLLRQWY